MGVAMMANGRMLFVTPLSRAELFEAHLTYSLHLKVTQMPRCQDMAILVMTTDRQN